MSLDYFEYKLAQLQKLIDENKQFESKLEKKQDNDHRWFDAKKCHPENHSMIDIIFCMISWWDEAMECYCEPIMVYWSKNRKGFFLPQGYSDCPLKVDIWCYWPELPTEKL